MRIPRIHTGQALQAEATFDLEPGPSQHIARALRMREGDELVLFDGRGGQYRATIANVGKKQVSVSTGAHESVERESPLAVHLGIAVSRGERMDWVVQKSTELGVNTISPLFTERTEVRLKGERAAKKVAHWQQIAISACEQCGRNRVPFVRPLAALEDWLGSTGGDLKLVLHHRAGGLQGLPDSASDAVMLVGPEGGLSPAEIESAEAAGYRSLQLGPRVLRTETAPLTALAFLQLQWGDLAPG